MASPMALNCACCVMEREDGQKRGIADDGVMPAKADGTEEDKREVGERDHPSPFAVLSNHQDRKSGSSKMHAGKCRDAGTDVEPMDSVSVPEIIAQPSVRCQGQTAR